MTHREQRALMRELAAQIRARRVQLGLTQRELGDRAGFSQAAISRLETGTATGAPYVLVVGVLNALCLPDVTDGQRHALMADSRDRTQGPRPVRPTGDGATAD